MTTNMKLLTYSTGLAFRIGAMSWLWAVTHVAIYTTLGSLRVASQEPDIYQTRRYQSVVLIHDSLSMVTLSVSTALYPIFYMLPDPHGSLAPSSATEGSRGLWSVCPTQ